MIYLFNFLKQQLTLEEGRKLDLNENLHFEVEYFANRSLNQKIVYLHNPAMILTELFKDSAHYKVR